MPVPAGTVDLYLGIPRGFSCAGDTHIDGCIIGGAGTADGRPAIYVNINDEPVNVRGTLAHELGHDLLDVTDGILTDADRARFDAIWSRPPGLGWWTIMRPCDGRMLDFSTGIDCGDGSQADEWAAEAYRLCATGDWRQNEVPLEGLPDRGWRGPNRLSDLHRTRAPIIASCGLIRAAAARRSLAQNR